MNSFPSISSAFDLDKTSLKIAVDKAVHGEDYVSSSSELSPISQKIETLNKNVSKIISTVKNLKDTILMKDEVIKDLEAKLVKQHDNIQESNNESLIKAQKAQEAFKNEWTLENNNALEEALGNLSQCESTIEDAKQKLNVKKEKIEYDIEIATQAEADRISNKNGTSGGANKLSRADLLTIKRGKRSISIIDEYIKNLS